MIYTTNGFLSVQDVDGTTFTGRYSVDNKLNVFNATGSTTVLGKTHPCGAMNVTIVDGTSFTGLYAANGSINVVNDPSSLLGVYHPCGAFNVSGASVPAAQEWVNTYSTTNEGLALFGGADPSIYIKDLGTPANDVNVTRSEDRDAFESVFDYTAPSAKFGMLSTGLLGFFAHNLYLNSASPANQSVTVVSGLDYKITVTGTVSITLSGAATGTVTSAASIEFTAATGTLTCGSTSGSGTVHVHLAPADETYLPTTNAARYSLPFEWDTTSETYRLKVERGATNLALYSNDLTDAAWTKSNMSTAKTATGPSGVANTATTITATAANATATQAITSASAERVTSVYIKRRTGSGNVDLTQDNGSTWTTQSVTSDWTRFDLAAVTSANPTIGIRLVTDTDAVDVEMFQHEVGAEPTSPIITAGSTVTRAADQISKPTSEMPFSTTAGTLFSEYVSPSTFSYISEIYTNNSNRFQYYANNSADRPQTTIWDGGVVQADMNHGSSPQFTPGDTVKYASAYAEDDFAAVYDSGLVDTDASGTIPTVATLYVGSQGSGGGQLNNHINSFGYVPERKSNADLQTMTEAA